MELYKNRPSTRYLYVVDSENGCETVEHLHALHNECDRVLEEQTRGRLKVDYDQFEYAARTTEDFDGFGTLVPMTVTRFTRDEIDDETDDDES